MPYLAWSDDLDTRIPELDAQHRVMVEHVNRLHAAVADGERESLLAAMDDLIECVRKHFVFEEKVLGMIDFAGLEEHRTGHAAILQGLQDRRGQLEAMVATEAESLIDDLGPWLIDHIRHDDLDFGPTVREWLRDAAPPDDPFRKLVGDT